MDPKGLCGAYLVFDVADRPCAIALERIAQVLPMAALSRPPAAPPLLAGFLALGGQAVAVLRLARLLELPEQTPGMFTPLLLLRGAPSPTALMVSGVWRIASVPHEAVQAVAPGHTFADCAMGTFRLDSAAVTVLACDHLLLEQERQRLDSFAAVEQRRLDELREARA
jgi:purine-binding chemotaxis protein CheW